MFGGCQNFTAALNSLHCSIRSKVKVIFAEVSGFDTRRAPRNCSRFLCWYGFHEDVLDSVYVPILLYCCTRITVRRPSDSSIRLRRTDASRKIPPQQIHAACSIVSRGSCCTKRFAEFNGNCESYCSLEQLVALLCAAHEGKLASGTYHPKTESYTKRDLYTPPDLLYCGGCTWTRISRQPTIAITWHFSQQTLLKPLTVDGRSERFLFR